MNEKKLKLVMRFPSFCFAKGQQREKIRENIVFQTNLYIQKKKRGKPILPVKERELYGFIGISLLMGYHKLPSMAGNVIQISQCSFYPVLFLDYALVRFCGICM